MVRNRTRESDEAPLFSIARFGPGSIVFLSFLVITAIVFYLLSLRTLALLLGAAGLLFFGVKSMERIKLTQIEERKVIGETCLVVKTVRRGELGIVRIIKPNGATDSELWSAESTQEIEAGKKARITGKRSVVLLIEPTAKP